MAEGKTITIIQKGKSLSQTILDLHSVAYESSGRINFIGTNGEGSFMIPFSMTIDENRKTYTVNPPANGMYRVVVYGYNGRKCKPGAVGTGCELQSLNAYPSPTPVQIHLGETFFVSISDMA